MSRPAAAEADTRSPRGRRLSIRTLLVSAITLQLVAACALVAWLSFKNSADAVHEISGRYVNELASRIDERIGAYVRAPVRMNEANARAISAGLLDPADPAQLRHHFWQQMNAEPEAGYLSFGGADGSYLGVQRLDDGRLVLEEKNGTTDGQMHSWELDAHGDKQALMKVTPNYDPRTRPWYGAATSGVRASWSPVYTSFTSPDTTFVTSVIQVRDSGDRLVGVLGADLVMSQANAALREITWRSPASVFIVDRAGLLVASSAQTPTVRTGPDGKLVRIAATDCGEPGLRNAARQLHQHYGGFTKEHHHLQVTLEAYDGGQVFELTTLRDVRGLQWLIAVVVPESAFMSRIEEGTRNTLLLCLGAALLAILVAFTIARRLSKPVQVLAWKARRIHGGDLDVSFSQPSNDEIGDLAATMEEMVQGLRDRDFIRDAFGRYVSPELAESLLENRDGLALGGRLRVVTVLMSDLRGFTRLSERLPPQEMVALLNRYLGAMTEVIRRHRGTIIEFIGDAILVVFGAPLEGEDDALRAVRCAVEMQLRLRSFNADHAARGVPTLAMGIGLNTGEVVAGNIGSVQAAKYGVVGEAVNLTARIESMTVGSQILMSQATKVAVGPQVVAGEQREVHLKGVTEALVVWDVRGVSGADELGPSLDLGPRRERVLVAVDLELRCFPLDGYEVASQPLVGRAVRLGPEAVLGVLPQQVASMSKLKLRVELAPGVFSQDAYAVAQEVVMVREHGVARFQVLLVFTTLEDEDRARIEALVAEADGAQVASLPAPAA